MLKFYAEMQKTNKKDDLVDFQLNFNDERTLQVLKDRTWRILNAYYINSLFKCSDDTIIASPKFHQSPV